MRITSILNDIEKLLKTNQEVENNRIDNNNFKILNHNEITKFVNRVNKYEFFSNYTKPLNELEIFKIKENSVIISKEICDKYVNCFNELIQSMTYFYNSFPNSYFEIIEDGITLELPESIKSLETHAKNISKFINYLNHIVNHEKVQGKVKFISYEHESSSIVFSLGSVTACVVLGQLLNISAKIVELYKKNEDNKIYVDTLKIDLETREKILEAYSKLADFLVEEEVENIRKKLGIQKYEEDFIDYLRIIWKSFYKLQKDGYKFYPVDTENKELTEVFPDYSNLLLEDISRFLPFIDESKTDEKYIRGSLRDHA